MAISLTLIEKLSQIQSELSVPKSQYNKFGKYYYRSAEDILDAVKPHLKKHDCTLTISDKIIYLEGRHYVEATAILSDKKEHITVTASAREEENKKGMDGAQVTGSTSSYSRKYALNGLFCIDDTKDPDNTNKHEKTPTNNTATPKNNTPEQQTKWLTEENYKKVLNVKDAKKVKATIDMYSKAPYAMKKEYRAEITKHLESLTKK
tara:strand:+ start:7586 stop:8203 length:618 start_codon:yes stop_codon:yes gene_type:complete